MKANSPVPILHRSRGCFGQPALQRATHRATLRSPGLSAEEATALIVLTISGSALTATKLPPGRAPGGSIGIRLWPGDPPVVPAVLPEPDVPAVEAPLAMHAAAFESGLATRHEGMISLKVMQ